MSKFYLAIGIVISLLIGTIYFMHGLNTSLKNENKLQSNKIGEQSGTIITNNKTIEKLKEQNSNNQDALILLRQNNKQSQELINKQSKELRRLINENDQLKMWANTALPDDIIRLYSRQTAIKGSDDYRKHLSESGTLPASSKQPD